MDKIREYYKLTKPGIVYGNLLPALGGFLLGSKRSVNIWQGLLTMFGLALVMAGACVYNNYLDRDIDARMRRTQNRALPKNLISKSAALIYALILSISGAAFLFFTVNLLATAVALAGLVLYVVVYGIAKRTTWHSTVIGSLSGATPPVVGYAAATGRLDLTAGLLFLIMALWQMPHFYAIAIFRRADYAAANLPIITVKKGVAFAKKQMVRYVIAYILAAVSLTFFGHAGLFYLITMLATGAYWLNIAFRAQTKSNVRWARKMFSSSLIVLIVWSVALMLNSWLF